MADITLIDKHAHDDGTATEWRFEYGEERFIIVVSQRLDAQQQQGLPAALKAFVTSIPYPGVPLPQQPDSDVAPGPPEPEPEPTGELIASSATVCACRQLHPIDQIAGWPLKEDPEVIFEQMVRILLWRLGAKTEPMPAEPTRH